MCEDCVHRGDIAEMTISGKVIAYFCKLNRFEYEICDVGVVSPMYECDDYKFIKRLKIKRPILQSKGV